jgi:hypothetical protein
MARPDYSSALDYAFSERVSKAFDVLCDATIAAGALRDDPAHMRALQERFWRGVELAAAVRDGLLAPDTKK